MDAVVSFNMDELIADDGISSLVVDGVVDGGDGAVQV